LFEHDPFGKPVSIPQQVQDRLFPDHALVAKRGDLVMNMEDIVPVAIAEPENAVACEYLGIIDPMPEKPIVSTAWTVLEAANDLDDVATVEACLRVIDADFSGAPPARSDVNIVFDFFN
jgi:hypothetical protein